MMRKPAYRIETRAMIVGTFSLSACQPPRNQPCRDEKPVRLWLTLLAALVLVAFPVVAHGGVGVRRERVVVRAVELGAVLLV